MAENPYSPPSASLSDLHGPAARPVAVKVAASLLAISLSIGLINGVINDRVAMDAAGIIGLIIALAFFVGGVLAVLARRNWPRWLIILITAFGLAFSPWSVASMTSRTDQFIYVLQAVMQLTMLLLMLLPQSARWYRSNNSFKPKPFRGSA